MKDVLHIHGGHDGSCGSSKIADQLRPFCLPGVIREPGRHLTEVLAGAERQHSPLLDFGHHHVLMILHQEDLPEAGLLRLMARDRQLLLQH